MTSLFQNGKSFLIAYYSSTTNPSDLLLSGNLLNSLSGALGPIPKHHQDFFFSSAPTSCTSEKPEALISNGLCLANVDINYSFSLSSTLSYFQCSFLKNLVLPQLCLQCFFCLSSTYPICVLCSNLGEVLCPHHSFLTQSSAQFLTHARERLTDWLFPIKLTFLSLFHVFPHKCQLVHLKSPHAELNSSSFLSSGQTPLLLILSCPLSVTFKQGCSPSQDYLKLQLCLSFLQSQ